MVVQNQNQNQRPGDRPIPFNLEAEEAVLGSLLLDRDAIIQIAEFLRPEDFFREINGMIYRSVLDLYNRREPPDPVTLAAELERHQNLAKIGGYSALAALVNRTPTAVHVEYYARIVKHMATLRSLISAGGEIAGLGYDEETDLNEVLARAELALSKVTSAHTVSDFASMEEMLTEFEEDLTARAESPTHAGGITTGLLDLDASMGGWFPSELEILAARPGVGKTSLMLWFAKAAAQAGKRVAVFSLEMRRAELMARMVAQETGLDSMLFRTEAHTLTDDQWTRIVEAEGRLSKLPIEVDHTAGLSISKLVAKAISLKARSGLDMVFVDYLSLVQATRRDGNRVLEVGEIARRLKVLAQELEAPVIACHQLNREVEKRSSHIPQLSDLRESGEIEAHADMVILMHRPDMYEETAFNKNLVELHVAKHRNGRLDVVTVRFVPELTAYRDYTNRQAPYY